MANISKKKIKSIKREKLKEMKLNPDHILRGKLTLMGGHGKSEKLSKYGRIINQKGAFGKPKFNRGLDNGIYETFLLTNHKRKLINKKISESKKQLNLPATMAKEL